MNVQWNIVGPAGSGKTTIAKKLCVEHLRQYPSGLVFVHDPGHQFTKHGCAPRTSTEQVRDELRIAAKGGKPAPRGFSIATDDDTPIIALAMEIGEAKNRAAVAGGRPPPVPMMVVVDESALMSESGATHMGKRHNQLLARRRHLGIAAIFVLQRVSQLPQQFYDMATDVVLFRQGNPKKLELLEEWTNVPPGTLVATVPNLYLPDRMVASEAKKPAEYVHIRGGKLI